MHYKALPSKSLLIALLAILGMNSTKAQDAAFPLGLAIAIDTVVGTNPSACDVTDGSISIEITNDQAAAIFSIDNGSTWFMDSIFTNLATGDYQIAVAYPDTFGIVYYSETISLINPNAPILNSVDYNLPNDCAAALGLIVVNADSTENLIYTINGTDWQEESAFFDVPAGNYNISVANAADTSCIQSWTGNPLDFPFNLPPTILGVIPTSPSECGASDGSLQALVTPGSSAPEYSIDGLTWFATSIFPNLSAGPINLFVRNDDGTCEVSYSGNPIAINDPASANIDSVLAVQPAACGDTNGSIVIYASGGEAPLQYSINGTDWQSDSLFSNLPVGNYTPHVSNATGSCESQDAAVLLESAINNCPDLIVVSLEGATTTNICLDTLVGVTPVTSAADCTGDVSQITMTIDQNSACVDLTAAVDFYGTDTLCVSHCNGAIPQICDTTYMVVRVLPPTDTIYVTMDAGTTNQQCLDNSILQYDSGTITYSSFCDAGSATEVMASNASDNCFSLTADENFSGQAPMICVVQCYDFSGALCDTTYVSVDVNPVVNNCDLLYQGTTIEQKLIDCSTPAFWCSDLTLDTLPSLNIYNNGVLVNGSAVACTNDPLMLSLPLLNGQNVFVFENTTEGCSDTVTVVLSTPIDEYNGATSFDIDCESQQIICLPIDFASQTDYSVTANGNALPLLGCSPYNNYNYIYSGIPGGGFTGPYRVDNWTVNATMFSGQFQTLEDLIDLMNTWNPGGNWALDSNGSFIYGGSTSDIYDGNISVTRMSDNTSGQIILIGATGFENVSIALDTGFHTIQVMHTPSGCIYSFDVDVDCDVPPTCDGDILGQSTIVELANCSATYQVCTGIDFTDWVNYDLTINGSLYSGTPDTCGSGQVAITLGVGAYELVASRTDFVCVDTLDVTLTCDDGSCKEIFADEEEIINIDDCNMIIDYCLPIDLEAMNNQHFQLWVNGAIYSDELLTCDDGRSSIALALGDHSISLIDTDYNCADELIIRVRCNPEASESVLNLDWNTTDTLCLESSNIPGTIVSIWNDCPDASGEVALVEFVEDNCFAITGMEPGEEAACFIQCDTFGNCDTLLLTIVVEGADLPDAQDDNYMATETEELNVNLLENDTLNGVLDTAYLIDLPTYGTAFLDDNGQLSYMSTVDTCEAGLVDSLTYAICTAAGCDTASILITIICDVPATVTGFSPNGDGINDAFVIAGLEDYPDHQLVIYNRWGAQILKVEQYQNDWEGTWEGTHLPDGTYFYLLDLGNGMSKTGWVQIKR